MLFVIRTIIIILWHDYLMFNLALDTFKILSSDFCLACPQVSHTRSQAKICLTDGVVNRSLDLC